MTKSLEPGKLRPNVEFKINPNEQNRPAYRPVQMVSLGCHGDGAALPHPDPTDPESILLGQNRRVCFDPPAINKIKLRRFRRFVRKWIRKNLTKLPASTDVSFEEWLKNTNYPEWRKEELRATRNLYDNIVDKRHYIVNGFVKDETYPEYKNLRGINARTDMFKTAVGPYFKLIEKELFKNPWFIKYVPVPDRPKLIFDTLNNPMFDIYATDHTSFEGHFDPRFMEACEFELYDYMTGELLGHEEFMLWVRTVLGGVNKVFFKYFSFKIHGTRMTGEMCTSLGNGFSNLMLILFVCHESGVHVVGFVEGDDSLFGVPRGTKLKIYLFRDLGFTIKLEQCDDISTASFCGNVFAPGDFYIVTDPVEALLSFGWTRAIYAKSKSSKLKRLLRSKALSLLYEYRGCPILKNLALYGLRMTEGFRAQSLATNLYEREKEELMLKDLKERGLPIVDIPINTRILVEKLYGITVPVQKAYEQYLDQLQELEPLSLELLDISVKRPQAHYFHQYVKKVNRFQDMSMPDITTNSNVKWSKQYLDQVNSHRSSYVLG